MPEVNDAALLRDDASATLDSDLPRQVHRHLSEGRGETRPGKRIAGSASETGCRVFTVWFYASSGKPKDELVAGALYGLSNAPFALEIESILGKICEHGALFRNLLYLSPYDALLA